jgi:hypothetical protein
MSSAQTNFPRAGFLGDLSSLRGLTLAPSRLALARILVVFSFVWPFFNYNLVDPGNMTEVNFLPVFLAALLAPEILLRDKWSVLLALPVFAVALFWANPTAPMRLVIGIVPLIFVLNLTRHLREQGQELIPANVADRCLQVFIAFCLLQTVQFNLFRVIPEWLTATFTALVPRYNAVPYDDAGVRGVQGWASEPAGAALFCIALALVDIHQRPDRRWRVLALFALLVLLNKSIYSLVFLILLSLCLLFTLRRRVVSLLAIVPFSVAALLYAAHSKRLSELQVNFISGGFSFESNKELMRFAQMLLPLEHFPRIYQPLTLYGAAVMEPMGLLPLLAGYGSVMGLVWLGYFLWRNVPRGRYRQRSLMLTAGFVLLVMAPPDLIPAVVAFAVFLVPRGQPRSEAILCLSSVHPAQGVSNETLRPHIGL